MAPTAPADGRPGVGGLRWWPDPLGYVSGYQLPLVADSDMRVDVEVVA